MKSHIRTAGIGIALLASAACADPDAGDPLAPALSVNGAGRLAVYNAGVGRAVPGSPCMAREEYRQFDFWIGEWEVGNAAGAPAGTNIVELLLDGCVLQENWVGTGGAAGRSINTWDRDTGLWHQTWVSSTDFGHLRMSGGWTGERMAMQGVRTQPNGVQWFDAYTWTPHGTDQLVQAGSLRIPAGGVDLSFALTYHRVPEVVQGVPAPMTECLSGGRSSAIRGLDFWLGEWRVERANGSPLGTASITSDLSGCLTVESFTTPKGYGAISYTYYDLIENAMYRTYIDSEGERVELRGAFEGGALVLTGTERGPGGASFLVRNTIEAVAADLVRQRWEVSNDGGLTWREDLVLLYRGP